MKRLKFQSRRAIFGKSGPQTLQGGQEEEGLRYTFCEKVDGGPVIKGSGRGVSKRKIPQIPILKTIFQTRDLWVPGLCFFPHSTWGPSKNLIFLPCFGHEGYKSPVQTAFLRHSSQKNRLRRYIWGGLRPPPPPPQTPIEKTILEKTKKTPVFAGFLPGRTVPSSSHWSLG
jgi:hypothetical protein